MQQDLAIHYTEEQCYFYVNKLFIIDQIKKIEAFSLNLGISFIQTCPPKELINSPNSAPILAPK
ncbi:MULTISPECIES: hypothetical protein [Lysinibacillus]|uniref:Uncharacterized protein n=1 Tax=Lysinibacillus xylanilyticus TaxID=582475 RepID=A0ABV3VUS0_9BACI